MTSILYKHGINLLLFFIVFNMILILLHILLDFTSIFINFIKHFKTEVLVYSQIYIALL